MALPQTLATLAQRSCDNLNAIQSVIEELSGDNLQGVRTEQYASLIRALVNNSGAKKLTDLQDVAIASLIDKQILQYDVTTGKWVNRSLELVSDKIDGVTIQENSDGKLEAINLKGMTISIDDLNGLVNELNSIKSKVDLLSNGGLEVYTDRIFATYAELSAFDLKTLADGKTFYLFVNADENHDGNATVYLGSKTMTNVEYLSLASAKQRDFSVDKIDLVNEVKGKLKKENIDLDDLFGSGEINLSDYMKIADYDSTGNGTVDKADSLTGLTASVADLNEAVDKMHEHTNKDLLDSLKTDGTGRKALYDDGVYKEVTSRVSFEDIDGYNTTGMGAVVLKDENNNVKFGYNFGINTDANRFQANFKSITGGQDCAIYLRNDNVNHDLCIQAYKYVEGATGKVSMVRNYSNGNSSSFIYNEDTVSFDGGMHIKNEYRIIPEKRADDYYEYNINDISEINRLEIEEV